MKSIFTFLTFIYLSVSLTGNARPNYNGDFCKKANVLLNEIRSKHFNPIINDSLLSNRVFESLLKRLDQHQIIFSESERAELEKFRYTIIADVKNSTCLLNQEILFLFKSDLDVFYKLLAHSKSSLLSGNDFQSIKKSLVAEGIGISRSKNWIEFLEDFIKKYPASSASVVDSSVVQDQIISFIDNQICRIELLLNDADKLSNYIDEAFFKAMANAFDPHTDYFSFGEYELFNLAISKQKFTFGIKLFENDFGEVEVLKVIPGSSAWKGNQINKGDVIVSVISDEINEFENSCSKYQMLSKIFLDDEIQELEIMLKKSDGNDFNVKLIKEKLDVEDNVISSFILNGKTKVGYLSLPGFYFDQDSETGNSGCANDIASEIVKLKRHNIEGLILDLRYNGGGSLQEAIELAGIFINEGPVFVLENNDRKLKLMKDLHRGTIFSGPLLVMVNRYSASATEIVCSALKEYNRAVIVGDTTFGKSTGQLTFPLTDTDFLTSEKISYLNLTTVKLYGVNGSTYQASGVVPHIETPILFQGFLKSEKDYDYFIDNKPIDKKIYYTKYPELPIKYLREKSNDRINQKPSFNNIIEINHQLSRLHNMDIMSEGEKANYIDELKENLEQMERFSKDRTNQYMVENNDFDVVVDGMNEQNKAEKFIRIEKIYEDKYVEESYFILMDLIDFLNKN